MKKKEENTHCEYLHDEDGICANDSCRKSNDICKTEWEWCEECEGKGYHKNWTK